MENRPSARLLVIDEENRVLLFRFVFNDGALAGKNFWATPGGAVEAGESYEDAAKRELFEETGIRIKSLKDSVGERQFVLPLPNGSHVIAQEKFFVVHAKHHELDFSAHTAEECEWITEFKWWTVNDLKTTSETVFPEDLADMLEKLDSP